MSQSEHRERIRNREPSTLYNPTFRPSGDIVAEPVASPAAVASPPVVPPEPPPETPLDTPATPPVGDPLGDLAVRTDAVASDEDNAEEAKARAKQEAGEAAARVADLTPDEE